MFFAYQTLDGIDGKQARRTGMSSVLGELMDHGLDAITCLCMTAVLAHCMSFGPTIWTVIMTLYGSAVFQLFTCEKRFTGQLRVGLG